MPVTDSPHRAIHHETVALRGRVPVPVHHSNRHTSPGIVESVFQRQSQIQCIPRLPVSRPVADAHTVVPAVLLRDVCSTSCRTHAFRPACSPAYAPYTPGHTRVSFHGSPRTSFDGTPQIPLGFLDIYDSHTRLSSAFDRRRSTSGPAEKHQTQHHTQCTSATNSSPR